MCVYIYTLNPLLTFNRLVRAYSRTQLYLLWFRLNFFSQVEMARSFVPFQRYFVKIYARRTLHFCACFSLAGVSYGGQVRLYGRTRNFCKMEPAAGET